MKKFRRGRKLGRTLYLQWGTEATNDDQLIGMMDTKDLATLVVQSLNHYEICPLVHPEYGAENEPVEPNRLRRPMYGNPRLPPYEID